MWETFKLFFDTTAFSPHGICLLWEPQLLAVHIVSDAVIALSYFSIPFALAYFVSRRPDVEFGWVFYAFALFILACGVTHVLSIYTLWVPIYGIEGVIKAVTAIVSVTTAILLWPLIPKLLAVPSPQQLRLAYFQLEAEAKHRQEAEAMLRQSQRMEAIGQLTGGVAHDFNNLLTIISGNLEMAKRQIGRSPGELNNRLERYTQNALSAAQRATTLTQRLLAFARKQPFSAKVINPYETILGLREFFTQSLGPQIQLEIIGSQSSGNVETDLNELEAALLNLVINARDAMLAGGRLTIKCEDTFIDEDSSQRHDASVGRYILISVEDNGQGMDPLARDRAFEPFFTTKQTGQGTGLGLSQVYGFSKQSGGFALIESEPGRGTSVKLFLPQSLKKVELAPRPVTKNNVEGNGEGILVVEDDDQVREYIVETLTVLKYHVFAACDAAEALQVFKRVRRDVSLLLTDVVMPGKNGRVLSEELLQIDPDLKVLFMTGYSRDAFDSDANRAIELLQKPITQDALADRVHALLKDAQKR